MAISRWTQVRLQIVAVVTVIAAVIGIAISWLSSRSWSSGKTLPEWGRARATA